MNQNIEYVLVTEEEINSMVCRIAGEIDRDYADSEKKLLLLCILKGSVVFMGELMKKITLPLEIDFMKVSSYGSGTVSSGRLNILLDLARGDIADLDIVIIEDIVDSGKTLSYLTKYLKLKGAHSVRTATLLDKNLAARLILLPIMSAKTSPMSLSSDLDLTMTKNSETCPLSVC